MELPDQQLDFSTFSAVLPPDDAQEDPFEGFAAAQAGPPRLSNSRKIRALRTLRALSERRAEALAIYRPLPNQLLFHKSAAVERLVIGSNRSGKSQTCGAEVAWYMLGCHPYRKVPTQGVRFSAVGWDHKHVGQVMWPKVGCAGSFQMIRDEHTRKWRPVVPDQPYDAAYREKWRDAPPFLPPRWIKRISWESKKDNIPRIVYTQNDGQLHFHSSKGAPAQGDERNGWWADEELENARWIEELERSCVKRGGSGFYSATPLAASEALYEMHRRAIDPQRRWREIEEFHLLIADNCYIGEAEKETFFKQLLTPQQIKVRWYGQFALQGLVVYPEYEPAEHVIDSKAEDLLEIPPYWNRYMVVDPGVQVCAVLFCAVPPTHHPLLPGRQPYPRAGEIHIYDELYIERCTAAIFAEQVARKLGDWGRGGCEAFIIDHSNSKQREVGSGRTVEVQYSDALVAKGVYSRQTASGFLWGSDDVQAREESLRRWLMHRPDTGKPTVRIHNRCRKLDWEMQQQFYRKDKDGQPTNKRRDKNDHAVWCLEVFADFAPDWCPPSKPIEPKSWAVTQIQDKLRRQRVTGGISLGPT